MTKIHPEAEVALDAVKGSEIITTMGEGNYVSAVYKDRALEALSQALFERDALRAQVAEMREALHELSFSSRSLISAIDQYIALPNAISGDSLNGWRNRVNRAEHSANEILSKDNPND